MPALYGTLSVQGQGGKMKKHSKRPLKLIDLIGAGCGIFLLVVLIVSIVIASLPVTAGVSDSQVPEDALIRLI